MENLQNLKISKNDLGLIPSPQKLDLTEGFFSGNISDVKKTLKSSDKELSPMEKEAYTLEITPSSIEIVANDEAGLFYGEMTVKQLVMIFGDKIPCLKIEDKPEFEWRGFMLDCCRNFFPVEFIFKILDAIALHKINRFHWHLTDDQGWRIPVKEYPLLTEVGAWRNDCRYTWEEKVGGFYTEDDIKAVVKKAADLHITVVPEIETPGHSSSILAAYPNLGCTGGPYNVESRFGIFDDVLCSGNDDIFPLYEKVFDTVCRLFPGPYVHIGGDECPRTRWENCPKCQQRKKDLGLETTGELQSYLTVRFAKMLEERGKIPIGWDEVLEGTEKLGLPKSLIVQSWRGLSGGETAAKLGHKAIMSPQTAGCYLDYKHKDTPLEPGMIGITTLEKSFEFEPTTKEMTAENKANVLGGQGNLWTECIYSSKLAEYMIFPRLCAIAEKLWNCEGNTDYTNFLDRLKIHKKRLQKMDFLFYNGD